MYLSLSVDKLGLLFSVAS